MKRVSLVAYCLLFSICLFSQQWHSIPNPNGLNFPVGIGEGSDVAILKTIYGELYIGGAFYTSSAQNSSGIEKFNVKTGLWSSFDSGLVGEVNSIELYNGNIYAGGQFSGVPQSGSPPYVPYTQYFAKWNGIKWSSVDTVFHTNVNGPIRALKYNSDLYIGGDLYTSNYHFMARYNGSTFSNMLGGVDGFPGNVWAMVVYKGDLIVGGDFQNAGTGTIQANYIARWDGSKWDSLGSGLNSSIRALEVDTVNNVLYAGGDFTIAGGVPVHYVAKWDGNKWSAVPAFPTKCLVLALKMFNGKLYGAPCTTAPSGSDTTLLYLDSAGWHQVYGPDNEITSLEVYNGNLYAGGYFDKIDTTVVNYIACYGDSCPGKLIPLTLPYAVNELSKEGLKFKVYPNPAKAEININVEGADNKEYIARIYNSIGAKITEQKFSKQTKISTAGFSKGNYQVQVCNSDGKVCYTEKVILQ